MICVDENETNLEPQIVDNHSGQFDDAADGQFDDAPECSNMLATSQSNISAAPEYSAGQISLPDPPLFVNPGHNNNPLNAEKKWTTPSIQSNMPKTNTSPPEIHFEAKNFLKAQIGHMKQRGTEPKSSAAKISECEITENDVLSGRGGGTNKHAGNKYFRSLVSHIRPKYILAEKLHKSSIAHAIVISVQERGGRFLKKDEGTSNSWEVISERSATLKASQALREGMAKQKRDALIFSMSKDKSKTQFSHQEINKRESYYLPNPMPPVPGTSHSWDMSSVPQYAYRQR
mmetsp:Transcript_16493/g.20936  ORF Transcript_16493/g.20936 Transcript_16493/m.20936 type:complete len:288 (-) Transcript_16493:93-956(-)